MASTIRVLLAASLLALTLLACGNKKAEPTGACIVGLAISKTLEACTGETEANCKAGTLPPFSGGAMKPEMKEFKAGSCADAGFSVGGCTNIPIAWTFRDSCPR